MGREQDARVAEMLGGATTFPFRCPECQGRAFGSTMDGNNEVVRRHCHDEYSCGCRWSGHPSEAPLPFTTDPAADYYALTRVRAKWDEGLVCDVRDRLALEWERRAEDTYKRTGARVVHGCTQYHPGDYALAALAVLDENNESEDTDG